MKPDTYAEPVRPMDWQDKVASRAALVCLVLWLILEVLV